MTALPLEGMRVIDFGLILAISPEHIVLLGPVQNGQLDGVTFDLAALANDLAFQMGGRVSAALIGGRGTTAHAEEVFSRGVNTAYVAEHALLEEPSVEAWARAASSVVQEAQPTLLLLGHTSLGKDLAPYIALQQGTGVVMGSIAVRWDASNADFEAVCPVFGGDTHAVYRFGQGRPRITSVRPRTVEPASPERNGRGTEETVVAVDPGLEGFTPRASVVDRRTTEGPRLEDAQVVIAGGLGLQQEGNYALIEQLADALGGLPAASRAIVDRQWAGPARQVGLTGKVVTPDLYVAVGISGASQHMAGCSASKVIVAVNRDQAASIFRYARYGVVTDCLEFLPILIEEARKTVRSG